MLFPKIDFNNVAKQSKEITTTLAKNPEYLTLASGIIFGLLRIFRSMVVSHRVNKERYRIDHSYYDPHTGFKFELRRKLTNSDYRTISTRTKNGDSIVDILEDIRAI